MKRTIILILFFLLSVLSKSFSQDIDYKEKAKHAKTNKEMLFYINKHLEHNPNDDQSWAVKGALLMKTDSIEIAIYSYLTSINLYTGDNEEELGSRYLGLAYCCATAGISETACEHAYTAKKLGFDQATIFIAKFCERRCESITEEGIRCKKYSPPGKKHCWQHDN